MVHQVAVLDGGLINSDWPSGSEAMTHVVITELMWLLFINHNCLWCMLLVELDTIVL